MVERRAWTEVNLSAIRHNVEAIKSGLSPRVEFCAVVKADGYGHGAVAVSRACLAGGADRLAVAFVEEGVELRKAGFNCPILIMGYTGAEEAPKALGYGLELTVVSAENAKAVADAALRRGGKAPVHIKVDTGMRRLGIEWRDAARELGAMAAIDGLQIVGLYSHFADADAADQGFAREQLRRFLDASEAAAAAGIKSRLRHIANSAATLYFPEAHLDMVRVGIALYGLRASTERPASVILRPALSVRARVTQLREIEAGETVGYGRSYAASKATRIAVLPLGYADGVSRALSNRGRVVFGEISAPIAGKVCMDQLMVDVSAVPEVEEGHIAVVAGYGGPPVAELADLLGTIDYEVSCAVRRRLPRVYVERDEEMSDIEFRKYHSMGNDYLVVDPRGLSSRPDPQAIRVLCDRTAGVGSDGALIGPLRDGSGLDLRFYNPDGSGAEKSGNGLLIYSWFLYEQGLAGAGRFPLMTEGGEVGAEILDPESRVVRIDMGPASFDARAMGLRCDDEELVGTELLLDGRPYQVSCVSMGNPHCAVLMNKVTPGHARFLGPMIEGHELFPHRANAVFYEVTGRSSLTIEIWERGAGYTLSSGTSACAAAAAARRLGLVDDELEVRMPGGSLALRLEGDRVHMTGRVEPLFYGRFSDALRARLGGGGAR